MLYRQDRQAAETRSSLMLVNAHLSGSSMPRDARSIDQVALKGKDAGLTRGIKYSHRYRARS